MGYINDLLVRYGISFSYPGPTCAVAKFHMVFNFCCDSVLLL